MHTHPFNGPFSGTTLVSQYQKGKTNLDFTEARDSEWQWHQLGHMQVCISLQTDSHASMPLLKFFTGWTPFLPPNQQRQSTEGKIITKNKRNMTHTTKTRKTLKDKKTDICWESCFWIEIIQLVVVCSCIAALGGIYYFTLYFLWVLTGAELWLLVCWRAGAVCWVVLAAARHGR